jgi:hypothetical protein
MISNMPGNPYLRHSHLLVIAKLRDPPRLISELRRAGPVYPGC